MAFSCHIGEIHRKAKAATLKRASRYMLTLMKLHKLWSKRDLQAQSMAYFEPLAKASYYTQGGLVQLDEFSNFSVWIYNHTPDPVSIAQITIGSVESLGEGTVYVYCRGPFSLRSLSLIVLMCGKTSNRLR